MEVPNQNLTIRHIFIVQKNKTSKSAIFMGTGLLSGSSDRRLWRREVEPAEAVRQQRVQA